MLAMAKQVEHSEAELPFWAEGLKGRLRRDVTLAKRCWFAVGGPADWLFIPEDTQDLCRFMKQRPTDLPLYILGVGSNLLVRDGGLRGIVLRLGAGFAQVEVESRVESRESCEEKDRGQEARLLNRASPERAVAPSHGPRQEARAGDKYIIAGAAALDVNVAQAAREAGIGGLEFLVGVPGTIGGAVAMNAGAYGKEVKDVLESAEVVDERGTVHVLKPEELGFSYRHSSLRKDWVCTRVVLKGQPEAQDVIAQRMQKIIEEREGSQPTRARTGGSTFKNPHGAKKAWQLIDEAGCRGLTVGDAEVSRKHCNFLINRGAANANELESLGEEVRRRVKENSGVELEWEIKRIGEERTP